MISIWQVARPVVVVVGKRMESIKIIIKNDNGDIYLASTLLYYISQVIWVSKYSTGW